LAILDYDLLKFTGFDAAKVLCEDAICSTVLLANESQKVLVGGHWNHENFTCLVKPLNRAALITAIELIVKNNRKIRILEKEILELRDSMETRKLVEKAKGILMKKYNVSEEEAFRKIQKQSMNEGKPMKELAENILMNPPIPIKSERKE
jgi:response regulator NasT